jgi:hypothetical protein
MEGERNTELGSYLSCSIGIRIYSICARIHPNNLIFKGRAARPEGLNPYMESKFEDNV